MEAAPGRSWLRLATSVVLALVLMLVMNLAGTGAGRALLRLQKEYRLELFNRAAQEQGLVVKMVSDEELQRVMTKYLSALADAVVRFEFFPRDDDASNFFELVSVLPSDVRIDRFEFTGRNLTIYCAASQQGVLEEYTRALGKLGCLKGSSLELYQKTDGSYAGAITCIPE